MLTGLIIAAVVIGLGIAGYFVYKHNQKKVDLYIAIVESLSSLPKEVKKALKKHLETLPDDLKEIVKSHGIKI